MKRLNNLRGPGKTSGEEGSYKKKQRRANPPTTSFVFVAERGYGDSHST
jgi:hypothetical protein